MFERSLSAIKFYSKYLHIAFIVSVILYCLLWALKPTKVVGKLYNVEGLSGFCNFAKIEKQPLFTNLFYVVNHDGIGREDSTLRLFENKIMLGPKGTAHALISTYGKGRFSHWNGDIFFSTSDNTSPLLNKREYTYISEVSVRLWVVYLVVVFTCFEAFFFACSLENKLLFRFACSLEKKLLFRFACSLEKKLLFRYVLLIVSLLCTFIILTIPPAETLPAVAQFASQCCVFVLSLILPCIIFSSLSKHKKIVLCLICVVSIIFTYGTLRTAYAYVLPSINYFTFLVLIGSAFGIVLKITKFDFLRVVKRQPVWKFFVFASLLFLPKTFAMIYLFPNQSGWMDSSLYNLLATSILYHSANLDFSSFVMPYTIFGSSYYMPLYQYGLAFVYAIFGHFEIVQQLLNALLPAVTIAFFTLSVWNITQNKIATCVAALFIGTNSFISYNPTLVQIENWYIPLLSIQIYFLSCYYVRQSKRNIIFYALSISFLLNMRTQAFLYFAVLPLLPFIIQSISIKKRCCHVLCICFIMAISLLPWTLRNYYVDGRFSPSSEQAPYQICAMNDDRIGFYGIRYEVGYSDVIKEITSLNAEDRKDYIKNCIQHNVIERPGWMLKAAFWRVLAFWGLLPQVTFSFDFKTHAIPPINWRDYLYELRSEPLPQTTLLLVVGAVVITCVAFTPLSLFLLACVIGSMSVSFIVGFGEPRLCYPVYLLLSLIPFTSYFVKNKCGSFMQPYVLFCSNRVGIAKTLFICLVLVLFLWLIYIFIGSKNLQVPLISANNPVVGLKIDKDIPVFNPEKQYCAGDIVQFKAILSNIAYPPNIHRPYPGIPSYLTQYNGESFYLAQLINPTPLQGQEVLAVSYYSATQQRRFREYDFVNIEGVVIAGPRVSKGPSPYQNIAYDRTWIEARKIVHVNKF